MTLIENQGIQKWRLMNFYPNRHRNSSRARDPMSELSSAVLFHRQSYGRGCGVGRGLGTGVALGLGVGVVVAVGVGVGVSGT